MNTNGTIKDNLILATALIILGVFLAADAAQAQTFSFPRISFGMQTTRGGISFDPQTGDTTLSARGSGYGVHQQYGRNNGTTYRYSNDQIHIYGQDSNTVNHGHIGGAIPIQIGNERLIIRLD